jgi:hypothetical protein
VCDSCCLRSMSVCAKSEHLNCMLTVSLCCRQHKASGSIMLLQLLLQCSTACTLFAVLCVLLHLPALAWLV